MKNLAVFVSGNGTNCENIIKYFQNSTDINIALVISNKSDAYALVRANGLNIPTKVLSKLEINNEALVSSIMKDYGIDFIVLAGFLLQIPDYLINLYEHRMINLHPALLPKFGGKGMYGHHVHEAIKAAGEKETGMTIHWVSNIVDGGNIIIQHKTPILPTDSPDEIAAKEHILEMKFFPQDIEKIIRGEL